MCAVQDPNPTGHKDRKNGGLSAAEKQLEALSLRKLGYGYEQIAEEVGYANAGGAHKSVMSALRKLIQEPGEDVLRLELERLDLIIKAFLPIVIEKKSPRHAELVLKAMDRRALYLGLDRKAPTEDHRTVTIQLVADQIAQSLGLSAKEVIAEAEAIIAQTAGGV